MDFVCVNDIVQANILAMESSVENETFNVGTNTSTSISQLARILIEALGADIIPEFSGRKSIVSRRRADITKIKEMLGYKVSLLPKEGLDEVAKNIKENPENY